VSQYYKNDDLSFIPFTREQENSLFELAAKGDIEARNKIVENYLQFAAAEGLREAKGQFDEDEVLSAANWGLMTAVQRYNPRKGNGFACFARRFIRGRVGHLRRDKLRQSQREISIGVGNAETHCESTEAAGNRACRGNGLIEVGVVEHDSEDKDWQAFWLDHVKKFITTLPSNEQIAIQVIIFEEGDFKILAARLKITSLNARRTYLRAIEALKKLVKKVQS
jgi:RNA polymerase sigma factor (sigma-70 family)